LAPLKECFSNIDNLISYTSFRAGKKFERENVHCTEEEWRLHRTLKLNLPIGSYFKKEKILKKKKEKKF